MASDARAAALTAVGLGGSHVRRRTAGQPSRWARGWRLCRPRCSRQRVRPTRAVMVWQAGECDWRGGLPNAFSAQRPYGTVWWPQGLAERRQRLGALQVWSIAECDFRQRPQGPSGAGGLVPAADRWSLGGCSGLRTRFPCSDPMELCAGRGNCLRAGALRDGSGGPRTRFQAGPSEVAVAITPPSTPYNVTHDLGRTHSGPLWERAGGGAGRASYASARERSAAWLALRPAEVQAPARPSEAATAITPSPTSCNVTNASGATHCGLGCGRAGGGAGPMRRESQISTQAWSAS